MKLPAHNLFRRMVAQAVDDWVAKYPKMDYRTFVLWMDKEYGVSDKMIERKLRQYGLRIVNGQLEKVES